MRSEGRAVADVDFAAVVRGLKTSVLLALIVGADGGEARSKIVDPDGALDEAYFNSSSPSQIREAKAEIQRRWAALTEALIDEIDRRIPIPEAT